MTYILVHGLGHGGWCWQRTADELRTRGHDVVAPDLPLTSLADDADTVARLIEAHSPAIVVGHSYGGLVISMAAARTTGNISHLVYLAAAMIGPDEDYYSIIAEHDTPLSAGLVDSDGTWLTVKPDTAARAFYNECSDADTQAAVAQLRPTSVECTNLTEPPPAPWLATDSLYIVCARDEAMPPGAQRILARKAARVAELDTDHSPFFSANGELCDLLTAVGT